MEFKYRKDLDGIRAIAVLSVVFFHAFPNFVQGGFIGVDVFFVISGFLISSIIFYQTANNQFHWTTFYIKRINRVFPTLIITLFCALLSGYFLLFSDEYKHLSKHIFGSTFFLNNFMLWKESGYFDITNEFKPLLHLWSLGIEEQFYLFWPLFIWFIWNNRIKPIFTIILLIFGSFFINILSTPQHSISSFYLPGSRFWELGLGGIIAYANTFFSNYKSTLTTGHYYNIFLNIVSILSISALCIGICYFDSTLLYPGWAALLPTLCTGALLCTPTTWINRNLLAIPLLTFIGIISYPLYLWHWELLSFAHIVLSGALPVFLTLILLILSFCLAWITHQFIEKPIRFSMKGNQYASLSAKISSVLLIGIGGIALTIYEQNGLESRSFAQQKKTYSADIENFEHYRNTVYPCEVTNPKAKNLGWCLQTKKGVPNKVIWGDSHADHLLPGLLNNATQENWLLLGQSSCPPLLKIQGFWIGFKDTCSTSNKIAFQTIIDNPSIDTVVLASLGPFYISDKGYAVQHLGKYAPSTFILKSEQDSKNNNSKEQIFFEGLDLTIRELHKAGKKIILFQDIPELPFMPTLCIHRPLAPNKPCLIAKKDVLTRQQVYKNLLINLKVKYPYILIFNPIDYMCKKNECQLTENHHLLYRDSHHLSIAGSNFIGGKFSNWLKQNPEWVT